MNPRIEIINKNISNYRDKSVNHPVYKELNSIEDISIMMEFHAYAVWDFMSLLKAMQYKLTCTSSPWRPVGDNKIRRLINSIVLEMYLEAMKECGAKTKNIEKFVSKIDRNLISSGNNEIDDFLKSTFSIIDTDEIHKIAAAFTFGREDLIPDMFTAIVDDLNEKNKLNKFIYYLKRHIELDGGEHGPLAFQLISDLCGDNEQKWQDVEETAINCLIAREKLWDAIFKEIQINK